MGVILEGLFAKENCPHYRKGICYAWLQRGFSEQQVAERADPCDMGSTRTASGPQPITEYIYCTKKNGIADMIATDKWCSERLKELEIPLAVSREHLI